MTVSLQALVQDTKSLFLPALPLTPGIVCTSNMGPHPTTRCEELTLGTENHLLTKETHEKLSAYFQQMGGTKNPNTAALTASGPPDLPGQK